MRIAIQIPIKKNSERVKGKNFRNFKGKPLYKHLLDRLKDYERPEDIYIDSESLKVLDKISSEYEYRLFRREEWFARREANGNHLLWNFACHNMEYDAFCQLFVTAVNLKLDTINRAIESFKFDLERGYDSLLLAQQETGFIWYNNKPVNYNPNSPDGLARSQDIQYIKETTGLYIITKEALLSRGCRVGYNPMFMLVDDDEASDIDTEKDFIKSEIL